ncbi:MAG: bifunctional phosphoribosyl-AMP cyclohydrolase/phosphoribosyl-ATP diphosphatase HisIE [Thermomicrobiaceae bacterium]|nr:bifunctional phosphoribosyl-AMP cyclohydrolase/phosphoribosyl-ATP diphosphatase HisIE [Thermomicrobiaceae bacterium]
MRRQALGRSRRAPTSGLGGCSREGVLVDQGTVDIDAVRFDDRGLVPAVVQDVDDGRVRMLGYMSREALERTLATGRLHFWSRSRGALWMKGETSGNIHEVVEVRPDCDVDALLVRVRPQGPTCHRGTESCFDRPLLYATAAAPEATAAVVDEVARVVAERHRAPLEGSYTSYLLREGIDKIGKKIGEEAAEVIIAAKNADDAALVNEASDLIYHLLVLLEARGVATADVWRVLRERRGRPQPDQPSS